MKDFSITTSGGKDTSLELQLDCDLATSTSLTSASSCSFTTPKSIRTGNGHGQDTSSSSNEPSSEWKDFYENVDRTPPKATRSSQFQDTVATANRLLTLSDIPDFRNKSFDDLTHDQQAIVVFMIVKNMHTIFGGEQASAKVVINALRPESKEYTRLMSFVRKRGDDRCTDLQQLSLHQEALFYVRKFAKDQSVSTTTIFKNLPDMDPFLHLQREDTYTCAYIACSALLYYHSQNNGGEDDAGTISTIKMNIFRYIRDEVEGLEIANFTLTTAKGAYLQRVLLGLLKSFGTVDCDSVEVVKISTHLNEARNYSQLELFLGEGRPFVFGIECFPELANMKRLRYTGRVSDYYQRNERPADPKDRPYHALLCTGIKPRNGSLPPMLLVQDSSETRPVFEIGLDLLMDLGLENLELCTVPRNWTFNKNMEYMVKPDTKAIFCGSPMALDGQGVPYVINAEKPVVQREDMSRYFDVVQVKRGETPAVYYT